MANFLSRLARRFLSGSAGSPKPAVDPADVQKILQQLGELNQRVDRLEKRHRKSGSILGTIKKRSSRLERGVAALLRAEHLDPSDLPYPQALTAARFRLHSQNEEDGITLALLQAAGVSSRRFVEIGSGLRGGNSAFLAGELGWSGMMVDADEARVGRVRRRFGDRVVAVADWIGRDNVDELLRDHGFAGEVDLLSIDIDGNDYWIWEAMEACDPRVVIVEYNSIFGAERAVTVPYSREFDRHDVSIDPEWGDVYYGASLAALARLAKRKGHRLVTTDPSGINAYFLRTDLAPEIPEVLPTEAFHMQERYNILLEQQDVDLFEYIGRSGLELVDVG